MDESVTPLADHVANDLAKIRIRLAKEGLADLNELPYERYLNTTLWGKIKAWVRARDQNRCRLCESQAHRLDELDVHHRSYDLATLEGLDDSKLISLCRRCHKRIEELPNGARRTDLRAKEAELARLMELFAARRTGLVVTLSQSKHRIVLSYIGDARLLEIAPFWHFNNGTMHAIWLRYRNVLRMPLPFRHEKFFQPAGARLIHIATNKPWLTFRAAEAAGSITTHKENELPVNDVLKDCAAGQPGFFWRLDGIGS